MKRKGNRDALVEELRAECQRYILEINQRDTEISRLHAHIEELRLLLDSRQGLGSLLRQLYNTVDNSIMTTINTRGTAQNVRRQPHPKLFISDTDTSAQLLEKISEYDVKNFFAYRPKSPKNHLKLQYRIVAKAYRTSRDAVHGLASKGSRGLRRLKK